MRVLAVLDLCTQVNSGPRSRKNALFINKWDISTLRLESRLMDRSHRNQRKQGHPGLTSMVWIAALLACWVAIVEWKMLPDVISATMAALP